MKHMGMKASSTETGIVTIGTMAEGMCQRKIRMTRLTMIISSDELVLQRVDRPLDQLGAVVGRDDAHARRAATA